MFFSTAALISEMAKGKGEGKDALELEMHPLTLTNDSLARNDGTLLNPTPWHGTFFNPSRESNAFVSNAFENQKLEPYHTIP